MRNRKSSIVAMTIVLAGCGAAQPPFGGAWTGMATVGTVTCTDGSKLTPEPPAVFGAQITQTGTMLSFPIVCGATLTFDVGSSGMDATQHAPVTCPPHTENSALLVGTISDGALGLDDDDVLHVSLDETTDIGMNGTLRATCTDTITGTLTRQP
jgi:hypothetical protein